MGGEVVGPKAKATANGDVTSHPALAAKPAIHIIVLGASGGPKENNVTALLVRSVASDWKRGSVIGVDAGVHLGAIEAILRDTQPPDLGKTAALPLPHTLTTGPFAGFVLPHPTPAQNALHFHQSVVEGFIITHPHLDHINGMVINTAAPPGGRAKRVAGLPYTIATLKTDIFNNRIWPNLTDENNGAGLVTFSRLLDGGSPVLGEGANRGYLEICDGLLVKTFSVSHGACIEQHTHRGSIDDGTTTASPTFPGGGLVDRRRSSAPALAPDAPPSSSSSSLCVSESSASFLRDAATAREVLVFGDVEPDSLSLSPRNRRVWREAAPKIADGHLAAICIECSYDDAQPDDCLYGHLTPRFLMEELTVLAWEVRALLAASPTARGKRKRAGSEITVGGGKRLVPAGEDAISPRTAVSRSGSGGGGGDANSPHLSSPTARLSLVSGGQTPPLTVWDAPPPPLPVPVPAALDTGGEVAGGELRGVKVIVIHVKDKMNGGEPAGERILRQLRAHEEGARLGCEFVVAREGGSYYL
ncbi:cAMP phosphodiesterases class-II-domain-containing protein [Schizothecium vesticola]|uniref:cAMP phosphodiesterases class-II-domain-containing protein n=1 Tax=Schizothecium vesticola TaxID=314040 RepID=A0AA40BQU9_9PEZI|nr:cAMP phosphodiesterases class-II-domain-containing protein [Schizothecium vesticola]